MKVGAGGTAMKTCTKCGEAKTLEDFHADKGRLDGKFPQCKECIKNYQHSRYKNRSDDLDMRMKVAQRMYHNKSSTKALYAKLSRESYRRNPERRKATSKEAVMRIPDWYVANKLKMPILSITKSLIEQKRDHLRFERLRKQLKQTYKEVFK